ncbi:MAG: hypothetical protein ACKVP5_11860 [Aestuariivirga sp.]
MRKLIWFLTIAVVVVWSGLAWLVHAAIGVGGNFAASNADIVPLDPETVEWISWLASFGTGVGEWLVLAVWAVVAAVVLAIGAIFARLLPDRGTVQIPKN